MGNKCCRGSDEHVSVDAPTEPTGLNSSTASGSNWNSYAKRSGSPTNEFKRKISEYQQILRDNQEDNLNQLREQLKKRPELFVLNNLVLSVQFFENFDRDKEEIRAKKVEQETNVNGALSDVRRRCHYEGGMADTVGRRYRYLAKGAGLSEVVPNIKYNIIHQNLEVHPKELFSALVTKEYASVDDPIYRFCVEDIENLPGWVMLRAVDIPPGHRYQKRSDDGRSESTTYDRVEDSDGYSKYSDYDSPKLSVVSDSANSGAPAGVSTVVSEIAKRPPMKTPDQSSSSTTSEEDGGRGGGDMYPQTGQQLMNSLEYKIKVSGQPTAMIASHSEPDLRGSRAKSNLGKRNEKTGSGKLSKATFSKRNTETSSEEDYDYTSINERPRLLQTPKSTYTSGATSNGTQKQVHRNSAVPVECFQSLRVKVVDGVDNPLGLGSQLEWKTYLSSAAFFTYFTERFYEWSARIDRDQNLQEASAFKSAVCCTQVKITPNNKYRSTLEFVPVIPLPHWPEMAREWTTRRRPATLDKRTNIEYRWPRPAQVDAIVKQGCHLVTEGGKFRGHKSANAKLEWLVNFGVAHETLFSSLSQQHLRALLWARMVFRHILAPMGVLSPFHIETVFFWLVESNYVDWPEASLGERVMFIFQTLYDCIKRRKLHHYFIKKRNLLHTKAPRDLVKAQEKLFRLIEHFVPFTLQTAKHLQVTNSVYPCLDVARLWEIVTTPLTLDSINPSLLASSHRALNTAPATNNNDKKRKAASEEGFWDTVQKQQVTGDKTRDLLRQERARIDAENREKRAAVVVDEGYKADTVINPFNVSQTKVILEFFIEHFIAMAQSAHVVRSYSTATVLLQQAENLATLLKEEGFDDRAGHYFDTLESLQAATQRRSFTSSLVDIPGTPCVFLTGVPERPRSNGVARNSSTLSSSGGQLAPKLAIPLPITPEERHKHSNGQANGPRSGTAKYELDSEEKMKNPNKSSVVGAKWSEEVVTTVIIEHVRKSIAETEPSDQYDSSLRPLPLNKAVFLADGSNSSELDESTDF